MDVINLTHALDITSVAGHTLSTEEIYVVQNALLILQSENRFTHVFFMGKIFGVGADYYVAFGYRSHAINRRSFFYSSNQRDWFVLGEPSPCALKLTSRVSQKFTGDPSHVIDWRDAGDTFGVTGRECLLKEEDRLGAVVYMLHEECAVAPKGAFFLNIDGLMQINPTFQGLSLQQGSDPEWWVKISLNGDFSNSGLKGEWSFRIRAQGSVCASLNLEWLGFIAYHRLRTTEHGFVYFGDGIKSKKILSEQS